MVKKFAILDIDGVILKGGHLIKGASSAVKRLVDNKIPFIFVTNGGGMQEAEKAKQLSRKIQYPILSNQIVLSHTPLKSLSSQYSSSKVLIVGGKSCLDIAKSYGFSNAVSIDCLHSANPHIYPLGLPVATVLENGNNKSSYLAVDAVMVFHDPINWGLEMQILSDVLAASALNNQISNNNAGLTGRQCIPFYATNADLAYTTEFPLPRFTQGAFLTSFKHLYETYHSHELDIRYYGKPYKVQYEYAENLLLLQEKTNGAANQSMAISADNSPVINNITDNIVFADGNRNAQEDDTLFFGIGDNPRSDIRGANNAGPHWRSILVRTGIFNDRSLLNDPIDAADYVCENISEAVEIIIDY